MTLLGRLWSNVSFPRGGTDGCWLWTGAVSDSGYGRLSIEGRVARRTGMAHRIVWAFYRGIVPDGSELDHLCRNRLCVRPDHLEPVTHSENTQRGHVCLRDRKSTCDHGHAMTAENTKLRVKSGGGGLVRMCRACESAGQRGRNRRHRAKVALELANRT